MTYTQVSGARRLATGLFAALVAGSLSFPSMALALDSGTIDGNEITNGTARSGEGTGGGTWAYDGADTTSLDNFVGSGIHSTGDTIIELTGDNAFDEDGLQVYNGDLTIIGDDSVYGFDKPSLTFEGGSEDDEDDGVYIMGTDIAIRDANIYINAWGAEVSADEHLSVINSGVYRGESNEYLDFGAGYDDYSNPEIVLQGSEIEATWIHTEGTLTIDNTNLTVLPDSQEPDSSWARNAVYAFGGITPKGETNADIATYIDTIGRTRYYLTTGSDNAIELKASEKPAYWGPSASEEESAKGAATASKGMPQTADATMPMVMG